MGLGSGIFLLMSPFQNSWVLFIWWDFSQSQSLAVPLWIFGAVWIQKTIYPFFTDPIWRVFQAGWYFIWIRAQNSRILFLSLSTSFISYLWWTVVSLSQYNYRGHINYWYVTLYDPLFRDLQLCMPSFL